MRYRLIEAIQKHADLIAIIEEELDSHKLAPEFCAIDRAGARYVFRKKLTKAQEKKVVKIIDNPPEEVKTFEELDKEEKDALLKELLSRGGLLSD